MPPAPRPAGASAADPDDAAPAQGPGRSVAPILSADVAKAGEPAVADVIEMAQCCGHAHAPPPGMRPGPPAGCGVGPGACSWRPADHRMISYGSAIAATSAPRILTLSSTAALQKIAAPRLSRPRNGQHHPSGLLGRGRRAGVGVQALLAKIHLQCSASSANLRTLGKSGRIRDDVGYARALGETVAVAAARQPFMRATQGVALATNSAHGRRRTGRLPPGRPCCGLWGSGMAARRQSRLDLREQFL